MGSSCTRGIVENIKDELWGYFALSGLLFLNIGIVLVVYALKRAIPYPIILEVFGLGLIIMGVLTTLASWYVHRQHRRKKPIFTCAFGCCKDPPDPNCERATPSPVDKYRHSSLYKHGVKFSRDLHTRKLDPAPEYTIKMFSTPEFQKYAEYMKRDTGGVEVKGAHKFKVESLRHKKHVHPQSPQEAPAPTVIVNAVYTDGGHVISQPVTVSSPILLKLSH